jgi:hypothetical protein
MPSLLLLVSRGNDGPGAALTNSRPVAGHIIDCTVVGSRVAVKVSGAHVAINGLTVLDTPVALELDRLGTVDARRIYHRP